VFNFQGSELIIILLLALVVLGPEKLPEAMRRMGRFYGDLKKMSTGFQEEFRAAIDEPTRELKDTANTLRDSLDFRKFQDGDRDEKPKSAEMAPADPDAVPSEDVPFREDEATSPSDPPAEPEHDIETQLAGQTSTPPAPPPPFSSSRAVESEPRSDETDRPLGPQVAVDDEHGLREARPAEQDGAA
jgi:sec-independent protein translocase protein TatB